MAEEQAAGFMLKLAAGGKAGEFLGRSAHCVIPPTIHPDIDRPYRWTDRPLLELDPLELPIIDPEFIAAVFASEHLPDLMGGVGTHDATFKFIGELANLSDDYDYIERVIGACFPDSYDGDSLTELPRMLRDTAKKFESGQWTKAGTTTCRRAAVQRGALALEFADSSRRRIATTPRVWTGWYGPARSWQPDDRRTVFSRARAVCREFARQAQQAACGAASPAPGRGRRWCRWRRTTSASRRAPTNGMPTPGCSTRRAAPSS